MSEGDKNDAVKLFALICGTLLFFLLLATTFWSYIFPRYLLERLYNEIDWESLKIFRKQKRGGRMRCTKATACCTKRQMMPR